VRLCVLLSIYGDWPINSDHDHWITTSGFHYERTRQPDRYIVLYYLPLYIYTYVRVALRYDTIYYIYICIGIGMYMDTADA
jgi:hypothetical protein